MQAPHKAWRRTKPLCLLAAAVARRKRENNCGRRATIAALTLSKGLPGGTPVQRARIR